MYEKSSFALCLTHDVDRPYKTYQSIYRAVRRRDPSQLASILPGVEPYWQFDRIMELEADLGVRSAFYFLNERRVRELPAREWLTPETWKLYAGRYRLTDPKIASIVATLDHGGWEVGIHGSYRSYRDPDRLRYEKATLEQLLGHEVLGGRQHYLNLDRPATWQYQADAGLCYDSSLGSSTTYGFEHGYDPIRPFDDEFVVFPLTLMELTVPEVSNDFDRAWAECERLLVEAHEHDAVMTILWHPCYFSTEYPGYERLYRRIVERALEMDAWVGPPGDLYEELQAVES
jgi:peptidoglycan/xylan/chitin deacetylase (PgdA/CDA1 family)